MKINRNNYKEYFLLYIDKELSKKGIELVDEFLLNNQDLQEEFSELNSLKLMPETVAFGDVSTLFRNTTELVNIKNYGSYFLLYVDNELCIAEKQTVEKFVLQHPEFQEEFILLKQLKLNSEKIEYPNKQELYKKEKKPLIFLYSRLIVAACCIGVLFFGVSIFLNQKKQNTSLAIAGSQIKKAEIKQQYNEALKIEKQLIPQLDNTAKQIKNKFAQSEPSTVQTSQIKIVNQVKEQVTLSSFVIENNVDKVEVEKMKVISNIVLPSINTSISILNITKTLEKSETEVEGVSNNNSNVIVTNASQKESKIIYKTLNVDEDKPETFLVGNIQLKKSKVNKLINSISSFIGIKKETQSESEKSRTASL